MSSRKNRSKQRRSTSSNTKMGNNQQTIARASSATENKTITVEDVISSSSLSEFNENKDKYFQQMYDDIANLEGERKKAEEEALEAGNALKEIEAKKESLTKKHDELQKEVENLKEEYEDAEVVIKEAAEKAEAVKNDADNYAETVRNDANNYADDIKKQADEERLNKLKEATEEAKSVYHVQAEDLAKQRQELSDQERDLQKSLRDLERDKRHFEEDKEELEELKEDLQKLKSRYEVASPAKIETLERELEDEQSKYTALLDYFHERQKELESLQAFMDTVQIEIEDPENVGTQISSMNMNEIISALRDQREKYERLISVYKKYPDDAAIERLEETAQKADELERENEALERERNQYRKEMVAAQNAKRELEAVKQEAEATNALNEHLLQELESNKTALENRTGDTCPSLTKVDSETETDDFKADIANRTRKPELETLEGIVSQVKNYAAVNEKLYYTEDDIRAFLAGMSVSRLIILEGMSGTGKSSLPRVFSEAISGFNKLIPVESSWRDRNELLGYYNDFNKKFNAKSFTIELYRSSKDCCQPIPTFIVLDEMNLARIEYYFSDFLAILQEPDPNKWLIELVSSDMRTLPMELPETLKDRMRKEAPSIYSIWEKVEKSRQGDLKSETSDEDKEQLTAYLDKLGALTGAKDLIDGRKIKVTDNIWFIGTANRDESTFEISDKVYDRAQIVSLNKKGVDERKYSQVGAKFVSVDKLEEMFQDAISKKKYRDIVMEQLDKLDSVLIEHFDLSFGNRIVNQTINFVEVFTEAGGSLEKALDYQISTKIIRKVISSDDEDALLELLETVKDYPETTKLVEKRLKELK